jgi:TPR repeat protein/putative methionine-R-sulfoxide reductase with GAF domain
MELQSTGPFPMAALTSVFRATSANRRRRVRHKIQTPAYATFTTESPGAMLDLHEIVDISEDGVAIQCHSPLELERRVDLCLDLADCAEHIYTTGQVVWSNPSGRAGLRFSDLAPDSIARLREWLFVNVMAGVANGEADGDIQIAPFIGSDDGAHPRPNYTDSLAAVSAVQRQVEALGADLTEALQLIAERAETLVRATGAAIALADTDPEFMVCRASSGTDAPPVGARLQVGTGLSGECVKTGKLLRCDDTDLDPRVDRESCRALGIRSILAAPVQVGEKSIGILEVFSPEPDAFSSSDGEILEHLAEAVLAAVNRTFRAEELPPLRAETPVDHFAPTGSVLFASAREEEKQRESSDEKGSGGISLPRSHLIILVCAAAVIFGVLGYTLAPLIQSKLQERAHSHIQTVLASSHPPKSESPPPVAPSVETATFEQLRQMAEKGDPAAQNTLGLRYATGEGVKLDEQEAVRWFTQAAEQGNVAAQSKLGSTYFSGRGVPQDLNRAYFWMVVARLSGDDASKTLGPFVRARLTRAEITSIELDADAWLRQHSTAMKPVAGH